MYDERLPVTPTTMRVSRKFSRDPAVRALQRMSEARCVMIGNQPEALRREKMLDGIAWGLFFLWAGVAWLIGIPWSAGLVVTGLIILGAQMARRSFNLDVETFWIAVGILFVLGGIWQSFDVGVGFVPVVFLLAGMALLLSAFRHRRPHGA